MTASFNCATFVVILAVCILAKGAASNSTAVEEYLKKLNSSSPSGVALVRSTESMLSTILDKVHASSNGAHKLRLYVLGDSVTRMMVSNWMLRWAGQPAKDSLQAKSAEEIKNLCNNRAEGDRNVPPCVFETERMKASFAWFQWFSVPHPLPKGVQHFQAVDSCFSQHSLLDCLAKTYEGSTPHDVTLIRMGLEYVLYATEAFVPHSCDGHSSSCYLPQWETEIRTHAANFIRTTRDVFKGTIVYLLLSPFGKTVGCRAPLSEVDRLIPKVNEILRSIYMEENVLFIDPYEMSVPFVNMHVPHGRDTNFNILESSWYGYFDCAHYAEPLTSLVLNRFLSTVIRQLPSEHLF